MKHVTLSSLYNFKSGYNVLLKGLLNSLPKKDYLIRPRSYSNVTSDFQQYFENIVYKKEDCNILLLPPCNQIDSIHPLFNIVPSKNTIFFTMWESSRFTDIFIDKTNIMRAIIVPNKWNKQSLELQGCNSPIHIVPLFVDTTIFNYKQPHTDDQFVFGTANDDPRKRINETIKCFIKAFPKETDVKLKVKLSKSSMINKFTDDRVQIIADDYNQLQLVDYYNSLNVFVSGVSAEGWGLHQHESMACGRPVIAANYAGLSEFMTNENSFCLRYKEVPSTGYWETPGGKWSKYDEDHMIETMRYCYNNPDIVIKKGVLANKNVVDLNMDNFINHVKILIDTYTQ